MHRSVFALAATIALLAACGGDDEGDAGQPGVDEGAATVSGDGPAFALVRGADTLLVEQYTMSGNRVSGTMRDPQGSSVEYQTIHATDGGERSMQITLRSANPADIPIISRFTLRGDSAWLETARGDSTIRTGDVVTAGALPYMSPSMGMMSLVALTARNAVGDSGQVALLAASISQNPVLVSPLIFWRADTAFVIGDAMNQFKLVFANGELMSAENTPQQMRFVRISAEEAAAFGRRPAAPAGASGALPAPQGAPAQTPPAQTPPAQTAPGTQPGTAAPR
jgi:hypothetical protein